MVDIHLIDTNDKAQVRRFAQFHYDLYADCPQWVPPIWDDQFMFLNREKHPFYEHSDADFFIATRGNEVVGRLGVLENKPFNRYHETKHAIFSLYDCIDDQDVANALFNRAFDWARARGLNHIVGPKGLSSFDGYGILQEGFEYRQMMNMSAYNYPYYNTQLEKLGFQKEVDFVSCIMERDSFHLPERIREIARRVKEKGTFQIKVFKNKKELNNYADKILRAYNDTFIHNWEYYPLSDRERDFVMNNMLTIADPRLIKIILHDDKIVGFLLGFQDMSAAMQRQKGKISLSRPWAAVDMLLELKRTRVVSLNGAGVLPEYHGRGGNALLYAEMEDTINSPQFHFDRAELTQVAETTPQMRKDLINVGGKPYKNHRVYQRDL